MLKSQLKDSKKFERTTDEVARVELRITHHLRQLVVFVRHMWIACAEAGAVSTKLVTSTVPCRNA